MSPNVSARVSSVRRKKETERWYWRGRRKEREDEGEFVRVSETRRVFIRRDGEWRKEEASGEGEINVFVLRPPSYALPGREKKASAALAEKKSHGEADGRDDVARLHVEYQPSVIAFVCKGRLFSLPTLSTITTHRHPHQFLRATRFFEARMCAYIAPLYVSLRFDLNRYKLCNKLTLIFF